MEQASAVLFRCIFFEFQKFDIPVKNGNCIGVENDLIFGGI